VRATTRKESAGGRAGRDSGDETPRRTAVLKRTRLAQDEALATGEGYFRTVLQDKDIAHQVDNACVLDVFQIDDAVAAGAKELCRVKPLLAIAKRSTDEHGRANPIDSTVVSLGFQPEEVGHAKNTTFDVVGENDEIVISKRDLPGELVNNLAGVSGGTVSLFECRKATAVFLWFVGGADWFSNRFRLHGL
jgi:hypothetical protein